MAMTARLQDSTFINVYQKTYLPNDFRLRIFGNQKVLEKVKNWTEADYKVS